MADTRHHDDEATAVPAARHLRVGIELGPRSAHVTSIWNVDTPVPALPPVHRSILARVDVAGRRPFVQAFDDPRIGRASYHRHEGHYFHDEGTGVVSVAVPFGDLLELSNVRIRVADASAVRFEHFGATEIAAVFDDPPAALHQVHLIGTVELQSHPDWAGVAGTLGLPVARGRVELYRDHADQWRWRLRRPDGEIVADSGQGYTDLADAERDLHWIREHVADVPVIPLPD